MRDNRERLRDIQEAIIKIEKYAVRGKQVFENDELIQIWIIHHLQITHYPYRLRYGIANIYIDLGAEEAIASFQP